MRSVSIKSYPATEILVHVRLATEGEPGRIELDGEPVSVTSLRLRTFLTKGTRCVACGIEGTHFRKERSHPSDERSHLNLYATGRAGPIEVLMTKDHIRPRSRGGPDELDNMQTMCFRCNVRKDDRVEV